MNEKKIQYYLEHFCAGRECVRKAEDIKRATGVSEKPLRYCDNLMRKKSIPIGSGQNGYFLCKTAGEVYATIRYLRAIVSSILAAIEGLERSLDTFGSEDS